MIRWFALAAFVLLIAVCARLTVPMTPVPMTLQTFAVLLAGAALGPLRGVVAGLAYLAVGALGLPVFSDGASGLAPFSGSTAGYLFAFPLAAFAVGALARRPALRGPGPLLAIALAGHLLILGLGVAWLAVGLGWEAALRAGFTPFLIGAAVKSIMVAAAVVLLERLGWFPGATSRA